VDIGETGDRQNSLALRSHRDVYSAKTVHWSGAFKPWLCNGEGFYSEIWTTYCPEFRTALIERPPSGESNAPSICSQLVITDTKVSASVEQMTVVIASFARVDNLLRIAQHLQKSSYIKELVVVWNNLYLPCPAKVVALPFVRCIPQDANFVHNRFSIWPEIRTEAVLHYDDDILAPVEDLEEAFQIWRRHPDQILGFEPRVMNCHAGDQILADRTKPSRSTSPCQYTMTFRETGHFDLVIGKLFIVSRGYMQAFLETPAVMALSARTPCEDLAMNFLVSLDRNVYNQLPSTLPRAPLLFKSNLTELRSAFFFGLSQTMDISVWLGRRDACLGSLINIFNGQMPGRQRFFYEFDRVHQRLYRLPVQGNIDDGWCSSDSGSGPCKD